MPTTVDIESQRMLLGTTPVRKIYQGTNLLGTRIAELFANGEQGVWYDPSDLSTLFQDAAGTIPVTAVEQPVGLMLDKSKGLVLGALTAAIKYNNATSGKATYTNNPDGSTTCTANLDASGNYAYNGFSHEVEAGKTYQARTFSDEPTFRIYFAYTVGQTDFVTVLGSGSVQLSGEHVARLTIPSGKNRLLCATQQTYPFVGRFTTAPSQVRELPGNHAYQTTATSRPVLSARVNLLTNTERFDNAVWAPYADRTAITTVTSNVGVDPHGAMTADLVNFVAGGNNLLTQPVTVPPGVSMTLSVWMRGTIGGEKVRIDLKDMFSEGVSGQRFTLTTEWVRYSVTVNNNSGISRGFQFRRNHDEGGTSSFYVWGADLRVANDGANLPPYQRVNTATDYDTVGFPHYLRFDGVDDWLVTPTITPGIDKAQVFAGVRKLSDAALGIIVELSADLSTNVGTFYLLGPNSTGTSTYMGANKGTINRTALVTGYAAPITNVLTHHGDISGDAVSLRINGVQAAQSTADQGTGNYLAYPLYIGRRGGTASQFNGRLYSLIVRFGSNLPAATIEKAEKYINTKTRAY